MTQDMTSTWIESAANQTTRVMGRAWRMLIEPTALFEEEVAREPGWGYRRYYVPLVLVILGLTTLLSWYGIGGHGLCGVCARVPLWIQAILLVLVVPLGIGLAAVVTHVGVIIAGGHGGLGQTAKALVYAKTPYLIFGWIPIIGSAAALYSVALTLIGIKAVHHMSWTQTFIAAIIGACTTILMALITMLLYSMVGPWAPLTFLAIAAVFIGIVVASR